MIDIERAKQEFINYTNNYDHNNSHIMRKIGHTFRVMEWSGKIAQNLKLEREDIDLAILIGLLHDIARFEQRKIYDTFSDAKSVDHGDLAVEILKENNFIRKFVDESKFDNIILKAVKNHNKFKIEEGLDERTLLHSKIVRDADKLDIMYEGVNIFYSNEEEIQRIENLDISEDYFLQFIEKKQIFRKKDSTELDNLVGLISFVFDYNFDYSKKATYNENFINQIIDRFNFKNKKTEEQMKEIRKIANEYLK